MTVFGFLGQPEIHSFLRPDEMKMAAGNYGFTLNLDFKPSWGSYNQYLQFCEEVKINLQQLKPRDMIDIQSFLWVQGLNEYQSTSELESSIELV
jgi:hypothetical protein